MAQVIEEAVMEEEAVTDEAVTDEAVTKKAEELATQVADFGKSYTRWIQTVMQEEAGTTPARARLLAALQCAGAGTMTDLSRRLDVTPRNITKLVDALESEGLVLRQAHPEDRRATLVGLTQSGVFAAKEIALAHEDACRELYESLSESDQHELSRILSLLQQELERQNG